MKEAVVRVRMEEELKSRAEGALINMGLSPSAAVRLLYAEVANTGRFPWLPNASQVPVPPLAIQPEKPANFVRVAPEDEID